MPTYEYHCDSCQHDFEEFQYIKDEPLKKCPKCQKNKLRRLISGGSAVVFRGSGFYQTDYRSDAYKKAAKAETAPKTESAASKQSACCSGCSGCGGAKE
ncbi:MAG: zinc ribbon domain-containing protein [Planctomycetaceae bacterium]|jgi:putative FmdB family regulatory protein|nr:zinc ribbon domain-containing protein [Planctomycetaceae bacterium]